MEREPSIGAAAVRLAFAIGLAAVRSPGCGGDLTGAWQNSGVCVDRYDIEDDRNGCPEWKCAIVGVVGSGQLKFGSDLSVDSTALTRVSPARALRWP